MNINDLCIDCFKSTGGEEVCMNCGFVQKDRPKQPDHLFPHTVLNNRYVIGTVINNGSHSVIYKAYDMKLETVVVIKELFPTENGLVTRFAGNREVVAFDEEKDGIFQENKANFKKEAKLMAKFFECESIVNLYELFEENNTVYQVMECLEGVTLKQYMLENPGALDFKSAIEIITPIMNAVKVLHKENILYMDVCPENIFITSDGRVKLIDFSAACTDENSIRTDRITLKPGYSAAELYSSQGKCGTYTDIYALGAVLYLMLTGNAPLESINRLKKDTLLMPSKTGKSIPQNADKAVMKAMAVREEVRFKSVNDFMLALEGKKRSELPEVELKRKKIIQIIAIVSVMIIVVSSVLITYFASRSNPFLPSKDTQIEFWYVKPKNGSTDDNWQKIAKEFDKYSKEQENGHKIKVNLKGIYAENYKQEIEKAWKNNKMPDVFVSEYIPVSKADKSTAFSLSDSKYSGSLKTLYKQIDDDINKDRFSLTEAYTVMKGNYSEKNQFAVMSDLPVLYYTSKMADDVKQADLDSLIATKPKDKFNRSLICSKDVVLDAAYAYGYSDGSTTVLSKLYNVSKLSDALAVFAAGKDSALYYIDYLSGYEAVEAAYSATKSFGVTALPGGKNRYVFPEVLSISASGESDENKASLLFLYYLISSELSQMEVTIPEAIPRYLPMLESYIENDSYMRKEKYRDVIKSDNGLVTDLESTVKRFETAKKISEHAGNKDDFKKVQNDLK